MSSIAGNIQPVCLAIGGLDPSGGAGIVADLRAFAAFGCIPAVVITSITFQNSHGVFGAEHMSAEVVRRQLESVLDEQDIAAVKTGMLPTREIVETVADIIREHELPNVVVDPVVNATSGPRLIDDKALAALVEALFPLATLVTPNVPETEKIAGINIWNLDDVSKAAATFREKGVRNVLIKGGHLPALINTNSDGSPSSKDFLFEGAELTVFEDEFIRTANLRGTGCMLASAIASNLALGRSLTDSTRFAKTFVYELLRR